MRDDVTIHVWDDVMVQWVDRNGRIHFSPLRASKPLFVATKRRPHDKQILQLQVVGANGGAEVER
jgi:hypothetical protein